MKNFNVEVRWKNHQSNWYYSVEKIEYFDNRIELYSVKYQDPKDAKKDLRERIIIPFNQAQEIKIEEYERN